jgi:hypothetical protein
MAHPTVLHAKPWHPPLILRWMVYYGLPSLKLDGAVGSRGVGLGTEWNTP